jgi:phenylacetate-coenzyme A ligase PaaK-like adenylate-forming protein
MSTDRYQLPSNNLLKTSLTGNIWPVFTKPKESNHLAMQYWLEQTQWYSEGKLRELQLQQAQYLIMHAVETVPYYRDCFKAAAIDPNTSSITDYWEQIPILKRVSLQQQTNALLSENIPAKHGKTGTLSTSGSTGTPVTVTKTELMQFFWQSHMLREQLWHQRDLGKKLASIRFIKDKEAAKPPYGDHQNSWGIPFDLLYNTGNSAILNIESPVTDQIDWLYRENPAYLMTNPSNLRALAQALAVDKKRLLSLEQITTIGEYLSPEVRKECEDYFQVPIADIYSSQEIGYMALQCPQQPNYHVQSECVLLEVLNEKDQPCKQGEIGRIVVTSLHNFATPLIRYEVGDYAEVGERCACGRGLPTLKRIYGRVRNMAALPTGETFWPRLRSQDYASTVEADIRQVQLIQHSLENIEVRLVVSPILTAQQELMLTPLIQDALGHPFSIRFSYLDEIPRSKGGKFEEFISHI